MFRLLFSIYANAPRRLQKIIVSISVIPRIIAQLFIRRIKLNGYFMNLDFSDNASFRYYFYRDNYEPVLIPNVLRLLSLNPGSYFLDVGAGYGAYSLAVASIGRYCLVKKTVAFEPDERAYKAVCSSILLNKFQDAIELHNCLVGDYDGEGTLLQSNRASTSNRSFASADSTLTFVCASKRRCVTLDSFLLGKCSPSFENETYIIKIDVEGNELRVFQGMSTLLNRAKGIIVQFEYFPLGMREVGIESAEVIKMLTGLTLDYYAAEYNGELRVYHCLRELVEFLAQFNRDAGHSCAANVLIGRGLVFPQ